MSLWFEYVDGSEDDENDRSGSVHSDEEDEDDTDDIDSNKHVQRALANLRRLAQQYSSTRDQFHELQREKMKHEEFVRVERSSHDKLKETLLGKEARTKTREPPATPSSAFLSIMDWEAEVDGGGEGSSSSHTAQASGDAETTQRSLSTSERMQLLTGRRKVEMMELRGALMTQQLALQRQQLKLLNEAREDASEQVQTIRDKVMMMQGAESDGDGAQEEQLQAELEAELTPWTPVRVATLLRTDERVAGLWAAVREAEHALDTHNEVTHKMVEIGQENAQHKASQLRTLLHGVSKSLDDKKSSLEYVVHNRNSTVAQNVDCFIDRFFATVHQSTSASTDDTTTTTTTTVVHNPNCPVHHLDAFLNTAPQDILGFIGRLATYVSQDTDVVGTANDATTASAARELDREDVLLALESRLFSVLHTPCSAMLGLQQADQAYNAQCLKFSSVTQRQLGLSASVRSSEAMPFLSAISHLRSLFFFHSPSKKMSIVLRAVQAIYDSVKATQARRHTGSFQPLTVLVSALSEPHDADSAVVQRIGDDDDDDDEEDEEEDEPETIAASSSSSSSSSSSTDTRRVSMFARASSHSSLFHNVVPPEETGLMSQEEFERILVFVLLKARVGSLHTQLAYMRTFLRKSIQEMPNVALLLHSMTRAAERVAKLAPSDLAHDDEGESIVHRPFLVCERQRYLEWAERDEHLEVVDPHVVLKGYRLYAVPEWVSNPSQAYSTIVVHTGNPSHTLVCAAIQCTARTSASQQVFVRNLFFEPSTSLLHAYDTGRGVILLADLSLIPAAEMEGDQVSLVARMPFSYTSLSASPTLGMRKAHLYSSSSSSSLVSVSSDSSSGSGSSGSSGTSATSEVFEIHFDDQAIHVVPMTSGDFDAQAPMLTLHITMQRLNCDIGQGYPLELDIADIDKEHLYSAFRLHPDDFASFQDAVQHVVREIQLLLRLLHHLPAFAKADGKFNDLTLGAVKSFQAAHNAGRHRALSPSFSSSSSSSSSRSIDVLLGEDGVVDANTMSCMRASLRASLDQLAVLGFPLPATQRPFDVFAQHEVVAELIREFQRSVNLFPDGQLGKQTLEQLTRMSSGLKKHPRGDGGDATGDANGLDEEAAARRIQQAYRSHRLVQRFQNTSHSLVASSVSKMGRMRNKVFHEIVVSERAYVADLEFCLDTYLRPLKYGAVKIPFVRAENKEKHRWVDSGHILHEQQVEALFSNLDVLVYVNRDLLHRLDQRMDDWPGVQRIADIFVQMSEYLQLYTTYINAFDTAIDLLAELQAKSVFFAGFLQHQQLAHGEEHGNRDLSSYLITPIQRIPRYRLLLEELLEHTPKEHVDYENCVIALDKIKHLADFVNQMRRRHDLAKELRHISRSLENAPFPIVTAGRKLMRQEMLRTKQGANVVQCWTLLFSDVLLLAVPSAEGQLYSVQHALWLDGLKCNDVADSEAYRNAFDIEAKAAGNVDQVEHALLICPSTMKKLSWMRELGQGVHITDSNGMDVSPVPETSSHAASAASASSNSSSGGSNTNIQEVHDEVTRVLKDTLEAMAFLSDKMSRKNRVAKESVQRMRELARKNAVAVERLGESNDRFSGHVRALHEQLNKHLDAVVAEEHARQVLELEAAELTAETQGYESMQLGLRNTKKLMEGQVSAVTQRIQVERNRVQELHAQRKAMQDKVDQQRAQLQAYQEQEESHLQYKQDVYDQLNDLHTQLAAQEEEKRQLQLRLDELSREQELMKAKLTAAANRKKSRVQVRKGMQDGTQPARVAQANNARAIHDLQRQVDAQQHELQQAQAVLDAQDAQDAQEDVDF